MKLIKILMVLQVCMVLPAFAGLYKWVDESGKVRYGDRPPPAAKNLKSIKAPKPTSQAQQSYDDQDDENSAENSADGGNKADQDFSKEETRKKTCSKALTNFKRFLPKVIELTEASANRGNSKSQEDLAEFKQMNENMNNNSEDERIAACLKDWAQGNQLIRCAANAHNELNMAACMGSNGG